jgi:Phage P22-like portal protein
MALTKEQRLHNVHQEAVTEFDKIQTAMRDERLQCLQDRRFYSVAGSQWEGPLGVQFENKPRLEVNKIHLAVIRIINEYRNNRITVNFVSKEGTESDELAETCSSLYRADEQDSVAEEAYDNAFEEAVGGGFGAWRLRTVYEDEEDAEDERQRIRIEPIFDADSSVFFDLNAKRQDKADAKHAFVLSSVTYDAFKEEWGVDPASLAKQIHQRMFDWLTPDVVYIAEYYKVELKSETVHIYRDALGEEQRFSDSDFDNDEELEARLDATGFREVRQKKLKRRRVHKYIICGNRVLEDCGYIAGKNIPIVPVYGKRWFVDNVERCMGHVRLAKDPQRLKNMQLSKLAEYAGVSSIEKPIFTPEQIAGHQVMWAEDNLKNYPYLLINQLTDPNGNPAIVGPNAYTKAPDLPPAMAALLQITEQDMQDLLGNQQAGEQLQPNISGKAIELIQGKLDMQTFIYMSNMAKAVKRSGEIWLSMAKDVLVEEGRKMKGINGGGEVESIELLKPRVDESGKVEHENDLSEADFDVAVDVGPSSASKRQTTVRSLTGMMQITQDPETLQVLGAMAMMNMEGEGIQDVRDYFRKKLIKMGVVEPTEDEMKTLVEEMQNTPPDPNAEFLKASADQAQAQAGKARADTLLNVAKAKESEAKTVETLANIDMSQRDQLMRLVQALGEQLISGGETPPAAPGAAMVSTQPSPIG